MPLWTPNQGLVTDRGTKRIHWASPEQRECFNHGTTPICASGGFGSGKTVAFCLKGAYLNDVFPGNRGVIARRTWTDLRKTTMSTFFKHVPSAAWEFGGRRSDTDKELQFNNGSMIIWMHLDDPETRDVIKGLEINWFMIDQAEDVDEEVFELLMGRLGRWDKTEVPQWVIDVHRRRTGLEWEWWYRDEEGNPVRPAPPNYAMLTCNPDHELHWIYRRFHPESPERFLALGEQGKSYDQLGYKMVFMDSRSNVFLSDQNKAHMMSKDESFIRRYVRGEWGFPEGIIHKIKDESLIPGDPDFVKKLIRSCTLHRILDHGESSVTACLWLAVDKEGNHFFYREYYMPNKLIFEHRQNIADLSHFLGLDGETIPESYTFNLADPSIFYKTIQKYGGRTTVADEYNDSVTYPASTALYWSPGDNDELGTRDRINGLLRVDPERVHPYTGEMGAPRVFFIESSELHPYGVVHALRELKSQRRKKIGMNLGKPMFSDERDGGVSDHGYDCIRYGVASRAPAAREASKQEPHDSFNNVRKRLLVFEKHGGWGDLASRLKRRRAYHAVS